MPDNCTNFATSEEYADFIVEYSENFDEINSSLKPDCIYPINTKYAIAYKKLTEIPRLSINSFAYNEIPKCYGLLDTTNIESTNAGKVRRQPNLELYGRGVIVGVVDTGIDYTNKLFINADNTSRIITLWDQTADNVSEDSNDTQTYVPFGRSYSNDFINQAIASENPLELLNEQDILGHGTFMAAIAAGNEDKTDDFTGMAPLTDIAVVKLKEAKDYLRRYNYIDDDALCFQESDIMLGIEYLIETAKIANKPIVICLGIGTNQGDHNGRSFLEQYIDDLADRNGIIVVTAGGNEVNKGHHFQGKILYDYTVEDTGERYDSVELKVGKDETGFAVELWIQAPNVAAIGIVTPSGEYVDKISSRPTVSREISFLFDKTTLYIDYQLIENSTGDQLILMRFDKPSEGIWVINVYYSPRANGEYNLWLPMSEFVGDETFFVRPEPDVTLCSPSNSLYSIVASGYNHQNNSIYINSSRGYTRYGRIKPDISAPAVDIYGPEGKTFGRRTGTSIAAAHTAGGIALILEWAVTMGNDMKIDGIKMSKYLIRGANRLESRVYPNKEWGWGTLDIYNTFVSLSGSI